jgi:orotidine-5'-phosphate decarboxylase
VSFVERLVAATEARGGALCVGLDPRADLLPAELLAGLRPDRAGMARAFERFCAGVIEAVAPSAVAVKPQIAHFEALGGPGLGALERVCAQARAAGLLVLLDAKRGDIGVSAEAYAHAWLDDRDGAGPVADALTVNPYLGADALEPFLARCRRGAGLYVLVRTSNPGGSELQEAELAEGGPFWERCARLVDRLGAELVGAGGLSAVGAIVGATYPEAVRRARELMPHAPLLLPGVGAQRGEAAAAAAALEPHAAGALVAASRSVIYAGRGGDWQAAVAAAAAQLLEQLRRLTRAPARG